MFFKTFFILGGKKAVEVHAAVWVPDGDAPVCMHCKKTQFTLINRRVSLVYYFSYTVEPLFNEVLKSRKNLVNIREN